MSRVATGAQVRRDSAGPGGLRGRLARRPPGQRLVWELSIDGRTEDDWRLPFATRRLPAQLAS